MSQAPILILGSTGYVGSAFRAFLEQREIPFSPLTRSFCDYSIPGNLKRHFETTTYRFVINCAGYTGKPNVDACERHKGETLAGNAVLPGVIREACESFNIPWGHVSSGCIYTGRRGDGHPFQEDDLPNFSFRTNNCSFYSGAKALGEEVLQGASQCYIWRLRIPFNHEDNPRNYLSKIMTYERLLDAENSISHLNEFVRACWESFEKNIPYGTYNVTNPGSITTRQVVEIIRNSGVMDKDFSFFESEDEFMRLAALTPRSNCVLDSRKLLEAGVQLTPVHEAIEKALTHWKNS